VKVSFSQYSLTPKRPINAKENLNTKQGLYLKIVKGTKTYLSDYFPHVPLGDLSVDEVLKNPFENDYFNNVIKLAQLVEKDIDYHSFSNHGLNTDNGSGVIKIKLIDPTSFELLDYLMRTTDCRFRLDSNASFKIQQLNSLLKDFDLSRIEYIEDPSRDSHWNNLLIASASDFIENAHAKFKILKPNRSFENTSQEAIISSYMGSDLGRILTYKYLMLFGNLDLVHGVITPDIYDEQNQHLFKPNHQLDDKTEQLIKDEILQGSWTAL